VSQEANMPRNPRTSDSAAARVSRAVRIVFALLAMGCLAVQGAGVSLILASCTAIPSSESEVPVGELLAKDAGVQEIRPLSQTFRSQRQCGRTRPAAVRPVVPLRPLTFTRQVGSGIHLNC